MPRLMSALVLNSARVTGHSLENVVHAVGELVPPGQTLPSDLQGF